MGISLDTVQAGRDIHLRHEEHHHYAPEHPKIEIQPVVDVRHLPTPTTALIGRQTELAQLTQAFTNPNKRLAIIVAAGGIGKSALTDEWLQHIAQKNYGGKTRVFGWSFYAQGTHTTYTNSQEFFSKVLPFLGITDIPKDEIEKARLLARCLQQQPCLLILDGLEPLQYAENLQSMNGELQDSALKEFIACFRQTAGKSFVLFSSRQPLVELNNWQKDTYLRINLKPLNDKKKTPINEYHIFDSIEEMLDDNELCFLQLLGLFDRPMNQEEKMVLINNVQYAKRLLLLTESEWKKLEQHLEKSGVLLAGNNIFNRLEWDTHPIIRNYFGRKFKEDYPEAFKQAHLVLFNYYQRLPNKELPDTLEEMLPLYRAVVHGCLAEEYQLALDEVYYKRIFRNHNYSQNKLGAYSQDLSAIAEFFPLGWEKTIQNGLDEIDQKWLLSVASVCLVSVGRLYEAIAPRKTHLQLSVQLKDWQEATRAAQNLVELYQPLGQLTQAYTTAQQAIEYAQFGQDSFSQIISRSHLATVLHQLSQLNEARNYFEQAAKEGFPFFQRDDKHCSLILDTFSNKSTLLELLKKAENNLLLVKRGNHLANIALGYLTLARIHVALNDFFEANNYFQQAVNSIEKANKAEFYPPFYLYRADFYLTQNQLAPALADLNSAWEIIERCGMKLYVVDYLLIHGRYSLATAEVDTALNHYQEAKQLIEETGYHLRDAELDLFAAQICHSTKQDLDAKTAQDYLQKAKNRIEEIGQWGLLRVIERDFPSF